MRDGRYKQFTNKLRRASRIADVVDLPLDFLPLLEVLEEVASVGACALAGVIDVAGCLKEKDASGAVQEFMESAAETLLVAVPGLGSVQLVFDLRQYVRDRVGHRWQERRDRATGIFTQDAVPTSIISYVRFSL